jgi:large subunit ribosomal protein L18
MKNTQRKAKRRLRRKLNIRKKVFGTTVRPRLSVSRSLKNIYAQIIDDEKGITICEASSRSKDLRSSIGYAGNIAAAKLVGKALAERAQSKGISEVCFDRNGYKFHGRVKGLADAAREAGLKF